MEKPFEYLEFRRRDTGPLFIREERYIITKIQEWSRGGADRPARGKGRPGGAVMDGTPWHLRSHWTSTEGTVVQCAKSVGASEYVAWSKYPAELQVSSAVASSFGSTHAFLNRDTCRTEPSRSSSPTRDSHSSSVKSARPD